MEDANDREATQRFTIHNMLVGYCGRRLTADLVDEVSAKLVEETRTGPTAWAFKPMEKIEAKSHIGRRRRRS